MTVKRDDKKTYVDLMSIIEYGGQWNCGWHDDPSFAEIIEKAFECFGAVEGQANDREFRASSSWQAAIYLLLKSCLLANPDFLPDIRQSLAKNLGIDELGVTITIFRGQRDPNWRFVPSIEQPGLTEQDKDIAHRATKIFSNVVHDLYVSSGGHYLEPDAFTAIARHYEMRCNLLDLTTDPSIAVFFACLGAQKGNTVATYFCPLSRVLNDVRIILPPPYAARLYRQRGFFIEAIGDEAELLFTNCSRILFPADPEFIPHRRIRNFSGDNRVVVLPGDRLLEDIKSEAERIAPGAESRMKDDSEAKKLSSEIIANGQFDQRFPKLDSSMDEWLIAVEDFLGELAIRRRIGSPIIDVTDDMLDKVASQNLAVMDLLMRLTESRANLLYAQHQDGNASIEMQLAERIARSCAKAMYRNGMLELPDELISELGLQKRLEPQS